MAFEGKTEQEAREEIKGLVAEYYHHYKEQKKPFEPGDRISYASRVFDEKEMCSLTDATLDFWLTTGRFANQFEKDFAKWIGVRHAHLVNSGSSANLIAFSVLTAPELGDRRVKRGDEVITVACGIIGVFAAYYMANIITAMAIFYSFVLIMKGRESIPYMLDDPDYGKVSMNSFEYQPEEYERLWNWIQENLNEHGIESAKIGEVGALLQSLFRQTEERNGKNTVLGECVLRFVGKPEIIIKDNGELFQPDIQDDRLSYNALLSCNSSTIHLS